MKNNILHSFVSLFYPDVCLACDAHLLRHEKTLCTHCRISLPQTDYHLHTDNPMARIFWGRAPVTMATAYYHFQKKSAVQHLIHNLKYKGHQEAGTAVGNWLGSTLAHTADYKPIDAIIPVPLHPAKLQKRGYNQATAFAQGLSEGMHVPYFDNVLQRNTFTQSQTRKNRIERWDNVADVFAVNQKPLGNARHLLLVDDVITTGATFEACIHTLIQNIPNAQVYVAAMAVGGKS